MNMKKTAFLIFLIVCFIFIFNLKTAVYAGACDSSANIKCGGVAKCNKTQTQAGCSLECSVANGFGPWAFPKCDCEQSKCWCECTEQCATQWCQSLGRGYTSGKCLSDKTKGPQCCEEKESICSDDIDNDCDDKKDCADKIDCEGQVCASNKVCKDGKCVLKTTIQSCPANCEWITKDCLCGKKETEVESGEFCCGALSKKYELEEECKRACEAAKEAPPGIFVCPGEKAKCPEGAFCIENPICASTFEQLIGSLVNFIFYLALAIAPIMFIIAGLSFVTAAGDPAKIQKARDIALWTAVGLVVILMAKGIISLIIEIFGVAK
jgi:hypothetical protein